MPKGKGLGWSDLTVFHVHDPVGLSGKLFIVGDDHEGNATLTVHAAEKVEEGFTRVGVEIPGRFIGEDEVWSFQQRPGNRHTLLLATGEFTRFMRQTMLEPDLPKSLDRLSPGLSHRPAPN